MVGNGIPVVGTGGNPAVGSTGSDVVDIRLFGIGSGWFGKEYRLTGKNCKYISAYVSIAYILTSVNIRLTHSRPITPLIQWVS